MIRQCSEGDFETILTIINDAARAYKGVIPGDCWHDPYMPGGDLSKALEEGIRFFGYEVDHELAGVMGIQDKGDVTLIRHAYVKTLYRNKGIGGALLKHLRAMARKEILIGTWEAAVWAIAFYEKHGFARVSKEEKDRLLRKYWDIPERQVETSVVLREKK